VAVAQAALSRNRSRDEELKRQLAESEGELEILAEEELSDGSIAADSEAARESVVESERALSVALSGEERHRVHLGTAEALAKQSDEEVRRREEALRQVESEIAGAGRGLTPEGIRKGLAAARSAAAEALRVRQEREDALREAVAEARGTAGKAAREAERYAATKSALARVQGRLAVLESEIAAETGRTLGVASDSAVDVQRFLDDAAKREEHLRRLSERLVKWIAVRDASERRRTLDSLRKVERSARMEAGVLTRAQARFRVITEAIQKRAVREEKEAVEHYRAAIQECFRSLLPHKHLDRIIDETDGAMYVTDQWLGSSSRMAVEPGLYLSTGQVNALALAIFFGTALRQRLSSLDFLMLDEPIQNLDDIHFLAFMTLLKRTALTRQVVISTADSNMADLVRRQIKSSWDRDGNSFAEYEWLAFSPSAGPEIVSRV
jgi:hypothetical protein